MADGKPRLVGYQVPRSNRFVIRVVFATVIMTLAILAILPFTQALSGDPRDRTLRSVDVANLPPPEPPPPEPPPPPEEEEEQEQPELDEPPPPMNLSQLESALNPGVGSAIAASLGFGSFAIEMSDTLAEIQTFAIADLDRSPRRLVAVPPVIPPEVQMRGIYGTVRAKVLIDENGNASIMEFLESPDRDLERPIREAVSRWKFEPPTKDGAPARGYFIQPLSFDFR